MPGLCSADARGGGWRANPLIGVAAILVIILGLALIVLRSCRTERDRTVPEAVAQAKGVMRYCFKCKKPFLVKKEDVDKIEGDAPASVKARQVPCPKCGGVDCTSEALKCSRCGAYYSPVSDDPNKPVVVCPNCGESLRGR